MVNSAKFAQRIEKVMEHYELSAAAFADKIDVGRSSISHILSGRNKPSLDFVLKIVHAFPEVSLYWLLNGKGNFPASISSLPDKKEEKTTSFPYSNALKGNVSSSQQKQIDKVIILYADGTFESFSH